jgi:hypothetical protein
LAIGDFDSVNPSVAESALVDVVATIRADTEIGVVIAVALTDFKSGEIGCSESHLDSPFFLLSLFYLLLV